jgi:hypothetical protein
MTVPGADGQDQADLVEDARGPNRRLARDGAVSVVLGAVIGVAAEASAMAKPYMMVDLSGGAT